MATPILKPNSSWFTPTLNTTKRNLITVINILNSYTPAGAATDSWDASVDNDGSVMVYVEGTVLTIAGNGSGKIFTNEDASYMFAEFGSVTSINGLNVLDTSNTTNMSYMFYKSKSITILNLSNLNTSNVKNMEQTFKECKALTSIDLSNWDTSNVEIFKAIFYDCNSLQNVNLGNKFSTKNAESLGWMFMNCNSIESLDLTNFETFNSKIFKSMFNACKKLKTINFGENFKTNNAEDMSYMFNECGSLQSLNVSKWNVENVLNMEQMFYRCNNLKELNVKDWNPKNCENFNFLCMRCSSLETFDASGWDIGKCKTMDSMFSECTNLKHFDTKNWKTSSVENIAFAFYGCKSFITLNCENWDVRNVETFDHFMAHSNMQNFDVSKWEVTSACKNLNAIFHSTRETYVDVTGWDTSNVITFNQICDNMINLEKIDGLETWNTSKGVCFAEMFRSCNSLKEINLSSFDTRKANVGKTTISANGSKSYGLQNMFTGCSSLQKLVLSENFTRFGNGEITESYYAYFPTPASGYWYTIDSSAYAPEDVPALTAATYYASEELAKEAWIELNSKKYVSLSKLQTFLVNLNAKFASIFHKHTISDISDYKVDTELSSTSINPVQNSTIKAALDAINDDALNKYKENIISLSIDGQTLTYIKGDGSIHSYTTQDTDTTYTLATDEVTGLTKLYAITGSAEDGTMTQKAITTELNKKVGVAIDDINHTLIFTI